MPDSTATIADLLDLHPVAYTTDDITVAEQAADLRSTVPLDRYTPGDDQWVRRAKCGAGSAAPVDPELFHPTSDADTRTINAATQFCRGCPVKVACRFRRYDLGAVGSVWGGVYYGTDTRGKRPCAWTGCTTPARNMQNGYCGFDHEHAAKVGTPAGYSVHIKAEVGVCEPCRDARQKSALKYRAGSSSRGVFGQAGAKSYQGPKSGRRTAT